MRIRPRAAVALAAGILLAGCGSSASSAPPTTTTTTPPLASGQQASVAAIPWSSVGPGWLLATWNQNKGVAPGEKAPGNLASPPTSLFLVNPQGGRYLVKRDPNAAATLLAWSGDGKRALFESPTSEPTFFQVALATGHTVSSLRLYTSNSVFFESISYTKPDGLALLITTQTNDAQLLERYAPTGALQVTYPNTFTKVGKFGGGVLSSSNGEQLVLGTYKGLALVDNDGTVAGQFPVPGVSYCAPKRWWAPNVVLASCQGSNSTPRLYKVSMNGGTVTAMTAAAKPASGDSGDLDAWAVGKTVYVQDAGGCGYQYLARLQSDGLTKSVTVSRVVRGSSVFVLGVANDKLAIQATVACGGGESALWYDPATNTSQVVLGPPINGGGVVAALSYPDPMG